MAEDVSVTIGADTGPFEDALQNLERLSQGFGSQLTSALKSAAVSGRDLDDVLRRIGLNLAGMALEQGLKPLQSLAGSLISGVLGAVMPFAKGGVPGTVTPFADGGVVAVPTFFPMSGGTGLMGEAGAEAILPLRRGADGSLGVASEAGPRPLNVVFNVTAQDATSFRKSEAQVTAMLARAVSRGSRSF